MVLYLILVPKSITYFFDGRFFCQDKTDFFFHLLGALMEQFFEGIALLKHCYPKDFLISFNFVASNIGHC